MSRGHIPLEMRWPLGAAPALALSLLLLAGGTGAETQIVTGATGTPGLPGLSGDPATDGGQGGTGESVSATATAVGEDNLARATGGDGGNGGDGGDASDPLQPGGAGGLGGSGGDATATAHTQGATSAVAIAHGGRIGYEGRDGDGQDPAPPPPGIPPANGGDAVASASLDYQGDLDAQVQAEAIGGGGVPRILFPSFPPPPPPPSGGTAGDATAVASGTAGAGSLVVEAEAHTRFDDVTATTAGGAASATAYGANQGPGAVEVTAHASSIVLGGHTSLVSAGPVAASAEGHSTSGDVTVTAIVEAGPVTGGGLTVGLHDAVSGSTAGHLTLRQRIHASSGDVETSLVASNPGGGSLALEVDATPIFDSGAFFGTPGDSADVRLGDVIGTSDSGADVSIDVFAAAASIADIGAPAASVLQLKDDGEGGLAPSVIHGASAGGDVRVEAEFRAGGINGDNFNGGPGADGGAVDMIDAVSGETTGHLWLGQEARGGHGQGGLPFFGRETEAGDGGSARSVLTHHGSSASLTLVGHSEGGRAGSGNFVGGAARSGSARSDIEASNEGGSVDVAAFARAGRGGIGGDATIDVHASSSGDGHAVRVLDRHPDDPPFFAPSTGARGGDAELIRGRSSEVRDGDTLSDGGDGTSHSTGIAHGDSEVQVYDAAVGGAGGTSRLPANLDLFGGDGGRATSTAVARGGGTSAVQSWANARGGLGGSGTLGAARGGDAHADASASGLGRVEATASAIAGAGGQTDPGQALGLAGTALATANASGASGFAHAVSATGGESEAWLGAAAHAAVSSQVGVLSESGVGTTAAPLLAPSEFAARSFVSTRPLPGDVQAASNGNAALAAALADGSRRVLGIASWDARASGGAAHSERSIQLDITLPADQPHGVGLAVFDVSFLGNGFQSLGFRLERDGAAVGPEIVFTSVEALHAHFADVVLELGPASGDTRFRFLDLDDPPALRAIFDLTLGEGDAFGMRVAYVVPEPSTGALLGLALVALALRRRRRR